MNDKKPEIAVTGPSLGGYPAWFFTALQVWIAGGKATYLPPQELNEKKIRQFDGIILGGGADISPKLYRNNEESEEDLELVEDEVARTENFVVKFIKLILLKIFNYSPSRHQTDFERDLFEMKVLRLAVKQKIPVFGICRGMQMINVFYGGKIDPDIKRHYTEKEKLKRGHRPVKKIRLEKNSLLFDAIGKEDLKVNAFHDQGILHLGKELCITASEKNGVIQGIEQCEGESALVMGVQWHPEFMVYQRAQRKLFSWYVKQLKTEELVSRKERFAT